MKRKNKYKKIKIGKYRIILLLVPLLVILSATYLISRTFLAEGQEYLNLESGFVAFEDSSLEDIRMSCGDIDGDDEDEILLALKEENSDLKMFSREGEEKGLYKNIFKDNEVDYKFVAGDIDGDNKDEVIRYFTEKSSVLEIYKEGKLADKLEVFRNIPIGIEVALGDINNDGRQEIIVGAGEGGGPQVKILNDKREILASFFVFNPDLRNGINIKVGNVDEDREEEIIVSQKDGGEGVVRIFKYNNLNTFVNTFMAYPNTIKDGADIIAWDYNNDGKAEIITTFDEGNEDLDKKMFNSNGSLLKTDNSLLAGINKNSKNNICNFGGREELVSVYNNEDNIKVKINNL